MSHLKLRSLLTGICIILFSSIAFSQNDNCANASIVNISNGGFGIGVFTSTTNDLTGTTVQPGETFAPAILVAGQNQKSIWYKFTVPTTRTVRVTLWQSGSAITNGDAGFAVYKTTNCLPTNADISTKLTPISQFASTFHPCVDAGDYLVQVSGKAAANGPVYITVELGLTTAAYDHPAQAYNFGTLAVGVKANDYTVDCQSKEDATEICTSLSNYTKYDKTTWHTFTTPAYFDYIAFLVSGTYYFSPNQDNTFGYRIYQGDASITPISGLTPLGNCDSIITNGYTPGTKAYKCADLQPNTTYSIQLFFKEDFNNLIRVAMTLGGTAPTQAPEPILSLVPASNRLGVLPAGNGGAIITTSAIDRHACNASHSLHPCNPSLPANGLVYNGYRYNLSSFFTFTLANTSRITVSAINTYCGPGLLMRLFKQDITNACSSLDTSQLFTAPFIYTSNYINCLPPGNYTLQVMAQDTLIAYNNYYYGHLANSTNPLCIFTNLGDKFNLNIGVTNIQQQNHYSLNVPGAFDTLNLSGGIMQPLQDGISYMSQVDTFGCANTVLPIDTACYPTNTKAIYREFQVADSGIVSMFYNGYFNKLYKGDANALAITQNVHNFPARVSGLVPYSECIQINYSCDGSKVCLVPGTYTDVTFSDAAQIGNTSQYQTRFNIVNTIHNSPANAENMGDILSQVPVTGGSVLSSLDYFSCKDNAVPINGYQPCTFNNGQIATKAVYRQFYLSSPAYISITSNHNLANCGYTAIDLNTLFSGKATDGIDSLHVKPAPWRCFNTATELGSCPPPLPAGWYTVVTYGVGPSYDFPIRDLGFGAYSGSVGYSNQVTITVTVPACPGPKYNRPYKASIDTVTHQPYLIEWAPRVGSTSAYPKTDTTYTLYTEHYNCTVDTPFNLHPIVGCDPTLTKVTYYVFKTTQESYLMINTNGQWGVVYSGDVRTDSASFATATPIQPCLKSNGYIQLCKVPPGTYTLVVFADNSYNCSSNAPTIYIDKVGYSRFDFANKAYDFGVVPPDSLYHTGKVGDVNPLDPGRAASNDFIYCTTGSSQTDPADPSCATYYNPNIYNSGLTWLWDASTYNFANNAKRNLWYSFVVKEGGNVKVKVSQKTLGKTQYQYKFSVFKSNVDGTLPFSTVVSTGQVDSTMNQGLTWIATNFTYGYCSNSYDELSFYRSPCSAIPERYYVLVENPNTYPYDYSGNQPNSQVEVSILVDSVNAVQPLFDHYSQASNIGTNLGPGSYSGATDNYSCATKDLTDPVYAGLGCANKTLWYKFSSSVTGHVKFRISINGNTSSHYSWDEISLYRQVIPGDSTSTGLQILNTNNTAVYDYTLNCYWGIQCISAGTYYIVLSGCNMLNEFEHPEIQILEDAGDFCSAPVVATLNGAGSNVSSVVVDCHTIGTDYGEFNPTLTCPAGMTTTDYKTSWFRIDITGTDTLDVTTYLSENTNATSIDIKYRLMNGTCGAMQERSCVQDALTQDTYKCLPPGSYWIQVFTPVLKNGSPVNGTIDLHLSAIHHADTCAPINNCLSNANFQMQFDCTQNQNVQFINYSTFGSSVSYLWNFGYNGQTSTSVSPQFNYPALTTAQTYHISLTVLNNICSGQSTYTDSITIPARPSVNLGRDTSLCNGGTLLLDATSHPGSVYLWQDGSGNPTYTAINSGIYNYFVSVTYNGCIARDTIKVNINPIVPHVQYKYQCNGNPILLDATRGLNEVHHWNTGATTSSINAFNPGVYWDDMYLNGCTIRDSFIVSTAAHPLGNDHQACFGSQAVVLNATTQGASGYTWQNGTTGPTFNATTAGLYWVDINFGSCSLRDTIVLSNLQPLLGNLSANICQGQTYLLHTGVTVSVAGVYADTTRTAGGCDSLINTLNLSVQNVILNNINATICAGQSYTMPWGAIVNTAGVYHDTLHYVTGCDSLRRTVNLTVQSPLSSSINANICAGQSYTLPWGAIVNTAGVYHDTLHYAVTGCDSLRRIVNLTVQSSLTSTANANICAGQSYTLPWGAIVNAAGVYHDTLHYVTGCDSLRRTVTLTVQNFTTSSINATICAGQSYTMPWGAIVNTAGVYHDTLHYAVTGCDSLRRTVNLTVQSPLSSSVNVNICAGQSYTMPWGAIVNTAGVYHDTLHYAVTGCDSLRRTVNLTVQSSLTSTANANICAGQSYTLPWGAIVNTAGVYHDTLHYVTGCDSLRRTVTLTVQNFTTSNINATICAGQSYTMPWGAIVNTAGVYHDTLHYAVTGCDSLRRTVNLTVQSPLSTSINANICVGQSYTMPWGAIVNTAGVYHDTLHYAITGCDSLRRTVNLTVQSSLTSSANANICAGQSYTLPWGAIVNTAGVYHDTLHYVTGCDSLRRTVTLTVQNFTTSNINATICAGQSYTMPWGAIVNTAGVYHDTLHYVTGCDSLRRTVNLTVQSPLSTSINANICAGLSYTMPWGAIVNTAGVYHDTLHYAVTGCDSLRRTVNLTVQSSLTSTATANICAGQSYTLPWGAIVNTAGVYHDTLHYVTGCDSLRITVTLTEQNFTTSNINATICAGQSYTMPWGAIVNTAGVYHDTLHYVTGCDSLRRTVNLTVQSPLSSSVNANICAGQSYTLPWGAIVNTAGVYHDTLHYAVTGCDSLRRTVNLTVQSSLTSSANANICAGQSFTLPWGAIVNTAGVYHDTLHYVTGCDSLRRTVTLTVQNFTTSNINATICAGQSYTMPWGAIVNTAGVYHDTLHYVTGCDSLRRTVNLNVQSPLSSSVNANICAGQSYTMPWGAIVNTAGVYHDTLHYAVTGCDSLRRTVNLTVQSSLTSSANANICAGQSYTLPWGAIVNTAGVYHDTLHYVTGCDSLRRTINLIVQSPLSVTNNVTICTGGSYTLPSGVVVNTAGIYHDTLHYVTGCDSLRRTINLTVTPAAVSSNSVSICSNETYTLPWGTVVNAAGNYRDTVRTSFGCDSLIRSVNLSVRPKPVTSISKSNDVNCVIGISKLNVSGGVSYLWSPAVSLSNTTIPNPVASPTTTTLYKVIVTAGNGCVAADSILVNFRNDNTGNGYLVPSAFTPNNDGINDCFGVPYWGRVGEFSMIIYNRWGETVFKTTDPSDCWDGTYKGVKENTAAFIYQISAMGVCGKVYRKGTVMLIR